MYEKARTMVKTKHRNSEEFEVKVGVHQGSVLSPLLFVAVMEVLTQEVREGLLRVRCAWRKFKELLAILMRCL